MREILFRGKNIYNDWIYGYLCQHRGEPVMDNNGMVLEGSDYYIRDWAEKIDTGFYGCNYKVRPSTVGQFTGLTDKNGRKIFEGDILKIIHKYQSPFDDDTKEYTDITTDAVFFDDEGLCFSYGKSPFLCVVDNVTAEYEVIGNIHDNPELLEDNK